MMICHHGEPETAERGADSMVGGGKVRDLEIKTMKNNATILYHYVSYVSHVSYVS